MVYLTLYLLLLLLDCNKLRIWGISDHEQLWVQKLCVQKPHSLNGPCFSSKGFPAMLQTSSMTNIYVEWRENMLYYLQISNVNMYSTKQTIQQPIYSDIFWLPRNWSRYPSLNVTFLLQRCSSDRAPRFCHMFFTIFHRLVGRYYSYLLPKQVLGTHEKNITHPSARSDAQRCK